MNKPDLSVKRVTTQDLMKNLQGKEIWLDIDATDTEGYHLCKWCRQE